MNPDRARQLAEALEWECDAAFKKWMVRNGCAFAPIDNLPDFSLPEWQLKIQEKVGELWVLDNSKWVETHDDFVGGKIKHQVVLKDGESTERVAYRTGYKEALAEVNTDALLWLAEQKAGEEMIEQKETCYGCKHLLDGVITTVKQVEVEREKKEAAVRRVQELEEENKNLGLALLDKQFEYAANVLAAESDKYGWERLMVRLAYVEGLLKKWETAWAKSGYPPIVETSAFLRPEQGEKEEEARTVELKARLTQTPIEYNPNTEVEQ